MPLNPPYNYQSLCDAEVAAQAIDDEDWEERIRLTVRIIFPLQWLQEWPK